MSKRNKSDRSDAAVWQGINYPQARKTMGGGRPVVKRNIESWEVLIQRCHSSSLTAKEWCKANQISYSTYKYWSTKINKRKKAEEIEWLQVPVQAPKKKAASTFFLRLTYKQIPLEIEDCTKEVLGDILQTLEKLW